MLDVTKCRGDGVTKSEATALWPWTAPIVFPTRLGVPHIRVGRTDRVPYTADLTLLTSSLRHLVTPSLLNFYAPSSAS